MQKALQIIFVWIGIQRSGPRLGFPLLAPDSSPNTVAEAHSWILSALAHQQQLNTGQCTQCATVQVNEEVARTEQASARAAHKRSQTHPWQLLSSSPGWALTLSLYHMTRTLPTHPGRCSENPFLVIPSCKLWNLEFERFVLPKVKVKPYSRFRILFYFHKHFWGKIQLTVPNLKLVIKTTPWGINLIYISV
jgi:hypothetical protein